MKLLVIDPHFTAKSPSMRSWVEAFPVFRGLFDEIELWASECEIPEGNGVVWKRFPQRIPTWTFHAMDFQRRVNREIRRLEPDPQRLVMVTGCLIPKADIRYIHFWNQALQEERAKRKSTFPLSIPGKLVVEVTARQEAGVTGDPYSTSNWWVVSRNLAERIRQENPPGEFHILPNQYDPSRFHAGVRSEWRSESRRTYGFADHEKVLVFSAFGHFERKGLLQALQAVQILRRSQPDVRLLVLGGSPKMISSIRKKCGGDFSGIVFAGLVTHIERHLVAADGLIFPSHFEAFSLAEIEAASLGLRLYLTPHYGSEMILREPENGSTLPWDPAGMAETIERDIRSGLLGTTHGQIGEALDPAQYKAKLLSLFQRAIERKLAASEAV